MKVRHTAAFAGAITPSCGVHSLRFRRRATRDARVIGGAFVEFASAEFGRVEFGRVQFGSVKPRNVDPVGGDADR
jgi:hypothetical protein